RRVRRRQRAGQVPLEVRGEGDRASRVLIGRPAGMGEFQFAATAGTFDSFSRRAKEDRELPEIGLYALRLGFLVALVGAAAGIVAGRRERADLAAVARRAVFMTLLLTTIGAGCLVYALVTFDFRLAYVAQHSARSMTLPYR